MQLMFLGINIFLALFGIRCSSSSSESKNIFMPKNINFVAILVSFSTKIGRFILYLHFQLYEFAVKLAGIITSR